MGDYSHLKNKKGELIAQPLPQPTLPNLSVDDDLDDASSMRTRGPPPSTYTQEYYDYKSEYNTDYPPMPAYSQNQPYGHQGYYNQSNATVVEDDYQGHHMYEDDHGSTAHLAVSAAPFAQSAPPRERGSELPNPYGSSGMNGSYVADPHDVYQGRAIPSGDFTRRSPQPQGDYAHHQGGGIQEGAYGDAQDYPSPTSVYPPQAQSFGAAHAQMHDDPYAQRHDPNAYDHNAYDHHAQYDQNAYDYDGQQHAEQGYHGQHGGGGGYQSHAM